MRHEDGNFFSKDQFFKDGQSYHKEQKKIEDEWRVEWQRVADEIETVRDEDDEVGLLEGRIKREELREELFNYLQMQE
jgi:hypothetical protein